MKKLFGLILVLALALTMTALPAFATEGTGHTDHCICGGAAVGVGDHTACTDIVWTPLSGALAEVGLTLTTADFGKLPSGNYYLDGDVVVTGTTTIGSKSSVLVTAPTEVKEISLCLNGNNITTTKSRVFGYLCVSSVLNICDCSYENGAFDGSIRATGTTATNGGILYTYADATVNVYGGNFVGGTVNHSNGGLFVIACDSCGDLDGDGDCDNDDKNNAPNPAVLNMYNGVLKDGKASNGGNIRGWHTAQMNLYGGTITGGTVVYAYGDINIYGGSVDQTIKSAAKMNVSLAAGKTAKLTADATLKVANFTGGGTLTLGEATYLNVTGTVSGTTAVNIQGNVKPNTAYITAPAGTAETSFVFDAATGIAPLVGKNVTWIDFDPASFNGIVLTAPKAVTVKLYSGFAAVADTTDSTLVQPFYTESGDTVSYYYSLSAGAYHFIASGTGYYKINQNLNVTAEKLATKTVVDANPGRCAGTGAEPTGSKVTNIQTDEVMEKVALSDPTLWPKYADIFTTPYFTNTDRGRFQATTQQEMMDYLASLDTDDDQMYIYELATTAKHGYSIPIVIFTEVDLSDCKTLEAAAEKVVASDKFTLHYQAQIHGNEPAAGEAALGIIKMLDGSYGKGLLDTMNIYVIPRVNPDGAQDYDRKSTALSLDANRDMLKLLTVEANARQRATLLLKPHMSIDSHEQNFSNSATSGAYVDFAVGGGNSLNNGEAFSDLNTQLTVMAVETLNENGICTRYYSGYTNVENVNTTRGYYGATGTLSILLESRGIEGATQTYERRTVSHAMAFTTMVDYVHENVIQVKGVVEGERQRVATLGATYDENDLFVLEHNTSTHGEYQQVFTSYNLLTGEVKGTTTNTTKVYDVAKVTRPRATAYVVSAGESWSAAVLDLLTRHGIAYQEIPAGGMVYLQQYGGNTTTATLGAETLTVFPDGAYAFTMNQSLGNVLAILMEPDNEDVSVYDGTLVQSGLVPANDCIYRYARDLNALGQVDVVAAPAAPGGLTMVHPATTADTGAITGLDAGVLYEYRYESETTYTAIPAGTTSLTGLLGGNYYIRIQGGASGIPSKETLCTLTYQTVSKYAVYISATGSDTVSGYDKTAAVASIDKAYARLEILMRQAPAGTSGKIVFLDVVTLPKQRVDFPAHTYPVILTSVTGAEGIKYTGGSSDKARIIGLNGPTTWENITLWQTNSSNFNYLCAGGHKLVIGDNVTTEPNSNGGYMNLSATDYSGTFSGAELVVKSGTWRNIYVAGYSGTVTGDVTFTMTGGEATHLIQMGYSTILTGNATLHISNTTAAALYCGNAGKNDITGDVTVTLGEGFAAPLVYAGSRTDGNVNGTVTIILDGADMSKSTTFSGACANTTGTVTKSVLMVKSGTVGNPVDFAETIYATQSTGIIYLYQGATLVETYDTFAKAAEADAKLENSFLRLGSDVTETATIPGGILVDLAGYSISGITVDGVIYGMDSTTDGYEGDKVGTMTLAGGTVATNVKTTAAQIGAVRRYLAIPEGDGYTFHRFYSAITHITLNTTSGGIGYKATFAGDEAVQAYVAGFGLKLALTEDFAGATEATFTKLDGKVITKTVLLEGIFKEGLTEAELAERAAMVIYAAAFVTTEDGETITSSVEANSLQTMVETIDSVWNTLDNTQKNYLTAFCSKYEAILNKWNLPNMG